MKKITFIIFACLLTISCNTTKKTSNNNTNNSNSKNPAEKTDDCIDKSKINPDLNCVMIYKPVCGCNNKTYDNSCLAEAAGVTKWKEGKCD
ncbi:MAG: hypothetical protein EAZ06_06320 [Cytophagales bacterium]|nr:MAG: hypothetical protein EAZ06_06320 [Cytophagales bacterium]